MSLLSVPSFIHSLSSIPSIFCLLATYTAPTDDVPITFNGLFLDSVVSNFQSARSHFPKPLNPLKLGSFNVRCHSGCSAGVFGANSGPTDD